VNALPLPKLRKRSRSYGDFELTAKKNLPTCVGSEGDRFAIKEEGTGTIFKIYTKSITHIQRCFGVYVEKKYEKALLKCPAGSK
jgi:hypothetical protein